MLCLFSRLFDGPLVCSSTHLLNYLAVCLPTHLFVHQLAHSPRCSPAGFSSCSPGQLSAKLLIVCASAVYCAYRQAPALLFSYVLCLSYPLDHQSTLSSAHAYLPGHSPVCCPARHLLGSSFLLPTRPLHLYARTKFCLQLPCASCCTCCASV